MKLVCLGINSDQSFTASIAIRYHNNFWKIGVSSVISVPRKMNFLATHQLFHIDTTVSETLNDLLGGLITNIFIAFKIKGAVSYTMTR